MAKNAVMSHVVQRHANHAVKSHAVQKYVHVQKNVQHVHQDVQETVQTILKATNSKKAQRKGLLAIRELKNQVL